VGDCSANHCELGICCSPGQNRDGDSFDDCAEYTDGNAWTDPDVFNGLSATSLALCAPGQGRILCASQDTVAEIRACALAPAVERQDQWSGWSFDGGSSLDICDASHGFEPDWALSCGETTFAVYSTGYVSLPAPGEYCFAVNAAGSGAPGAECGSLVLNGDSSPLVTTENMAAVCVASTGASSARLELYYQQTSAPNPPVQNAGYAFHVTTCYAANGTPCVPGDPLPPERLRVSP
jgi:hypothetical protein